MFTYCNCGVVVFKVVSNIFQDMKINKNIQLYSLQWKEQDLYK